MTNKKETTSAITAASETSAVQTQPQDKPLKEVVKQNPVSQPTLVEKKEIKPQPQEKKEVVKPTPAPEIKQEVRLEKKESEEQNQLFVDQK